MKNLEILQVLVRIVVILAFISFSDAFPDDRWLELAADGLNYHPLVFRVFFALSLSTLLLRWRDFYSKIGMKALSMTLALVLIGVLSALFAENTGLAFRGTTSLAFSTLAALYVAGNFTLKQTLEFLSTSLGVLITLSFMVCIFYPEMGLTRDYFKMEHMGLWKGVFSHKNVLAWYAHMSCVCFGLRWAFREGYRPLNALLGILSFYVLIQSGGKAAIVSLFAVSIFGLIGSNIWKRRTLLLYLVGMLSILLGTTYWYYTVLEKTERLVTFTGRVQLWETLFSFYKAKPVLGYGLNNFWTSHNVEVFLEQGWQMTQAHNGYLEILLSFGGLGLGVFLGVYYYMFKKYSFLNKKISRYEWKVSMLILVSIGLCNVFEYTVLRSFNLHWVLFLVLLLAIPKQTAGESFQRKS